MDLNILNQVQNDCGDPLSQLQQMFAATASGQAESPMDFLMNGAFSQVEIEIPVGYGVSIVVRLPQKLLETVTDEVEKFILDKMLNKGGALFITIKWIEVGLIDALVYLNTRCGLAVIVRTCNGEQISDGFLDIIAKVANTLIETANDSQIDVNILEWQRLEEYFNRVYYSGLMRTSTDIRYIKYKVGL